MPATPQRTSLPTAGVLPSVLPALPRVDRWAPWPPGAGYSTSPARALLPSRRKHRPNKLPGQEPLQPGVCVRLPLPCPASSTGLYLATHSPSLSALVQRRRQLPPAPAPRSSVHTPPPRALVSPHLSAPPQSARVADSRLREHVWRQQGSCAPLTRSLLQGQNSVHCVGGQ